MSATTISANQRASHRSARAWPGSTSGIEEYTGAWGTAQVVHLLKRTLFGASVADVNYFSGLSMSAAVDLLLTPTAAPTTQPLNNYGTDVTGVGSYQTWIGTGLLYQDATLNASRVGSMQCWWMGQLLSETSRSTKR